MQHRTTPAPARRGVVGTTITFKETFEKGPIFGLGHSCRESLFAQMERRSGGRNYTDHGPDLWASEAAVCIHRDLSSLFAKCILQTPVNHSSDIGFWSNCQKQFRQIGARQKGH